MHRLTKLFLALALVMSVGGLTAGTIDFTGLVVPSPPGVGDGFPLASASDDGTTVFFFTAPSGSLSTSSAYGADQGTPKTAFANNEEGDDTVDGSANGEFLTDEPQGNSIARDYLFAISGIPILDFGLDLYDFGDSLFSGTGGTATLQAFSDTGWTSPIGAAATYVVPDFSITPFDDGNIQTLHVNPGTSIGSVRLSFSTGASTPGQDTGTGIDNITWSTIPEPGTVVLFGTGLLGLAAMARKRRIRADGKQS